VEEELACVEGELPGGGGEVVFVGFGAATLLDERLLLREVTKLFNRAFIEDMGLKALIRERKKRNEEKVKRKRVGTVVWIGLVRLVVAQALALAQAQAQAGQGHATPALQLNMRMAKRNQPAQAWPATDTNMNERPANNVSVSSL
jgi:hypothetical protein